MRKRREENGFIQEIFHIMSHVIRSQLAKLNILRKIFCKPSHKLKKINEGCALIETVRLYKNRNNKPDIQQICLTELLNSMELCPWEEIHEFQSERRFNDFLKWLSEQINDGIAKEICAPKENSPCNIRDKWFVHNESKLIWHLIWPDMTTLTGAFKIYIENFNDIWTETLIHREEDYKLLSQWMNKQIHLENTFQKNGIGVSTIHGIKFDNGNIDFKDWGDNEIHLKWLNEQIELGKAARVSIETPLIGTFVQIVSGQVWDLYPPDDRGHSGHFKRIEIADINEKLARLRFLLKKHLVILKKNNGCSYIKDIAKILKDLTNNKKSSKTLLNAARSYYQPLIKGHGTLERFMIYHEDEKIQAELNNNLTEAMQETCDLLDLRFSRLPTVEEEYPPGHIYWKIKDEK